MTVYADNKDFFQDVRLPEISSSENILAIKKEKVSFIRVNSKGEALPTESPIWFTEVISSEDNTLQ